MTRNKYCCGGFNAVLVAGLWPVVEDGIKWYTALYQCHICKEYMVRYETNQKSEFNTKVKYITMEVAHGLIEEVQQLADTARVEAH